MKRRHFLAASAAALAAPAVAQPAKTATLRFVPQANLTLLDPILTTAIVTCNHAYHVFDTLYSNAPDGTPKPQMATGAEVSADGRTWRIGLRDGLKFHDGSPVLARDAAASISRWAKREPFGQLLDKVVDTYGTAGDKTVEIKLKKPFPLLLNAIGKPDSSLPFVMPERLAQIRRRIRLSRLRPGSRRLSWLKLRGRTLVLRSIPTDRGKFLDGLSSRRVQPAAGTQHAHQCTD